MFNYLPDEIIHHIMLYENLYTLINNLFINKHINLLFNMNIENLCQNILDNKKIKLIETKAAYNFCQQNHTTSITKNNKSSLIKSLYLSNLFKK